MNLEKIHEYLQHYLDDVITPNINRELAVDGDEPITLSVYTLRMGSYNPPIFHVFIDGAPNWKGIVLKRLEKDVENFMKIFSMNNKVKVHWNKRPAF